MGADDHYHDGFVDRLGERAIWLRGLRPGGTQHLRLFVGGSPSRTSWVIHLERQGWAWAGYLRKHDGRKIAVSKRFGVAQADIAELLALASASGLWKAHPQFSKRAPNPDVICLDGLSLIFERLGVDGYRYSESSQCYIEPSQLAVALKIVRIANHPDLEAQLDN